MAENTKDAFVLVEYALHNILQQEASGGQLSNQALGYEAVECYYVRILCCALVFPLLAEADLDACKIALGMRSRVSTAP